ncbi:uncharacterized [Tachysurus ichikawai]
MSAKLATVSRTVTSQAALASSHYGSRTPLRERVSPGLDSFPRTRFNQPCCGGSAVGTVDSEPIRTSAKGLHQHGIKLRSPRTKEEFSRPPST